MSTNQPERSPRRGMCAAVLSLEAITLGLTTPVMIKVSGVDTPIALAVGLGLAALCLLIAGMLRSEWAYALGWLVLTTVSGAASTGPRRPSRPNR